MIKFNFNQTGGFPLNTDTFSRMQDAYSVVENVAKMAGDLAIINGCTELGVQATDGTVLINGELLDFKGGIIESTVHIVTETQSKIFENGEYKEVEIYRYATFGQGDDNYEWPQFKRVIPLNTISEKINKMEALLSPLLDGGLLLWNKPANTIPDGWAEATEFRGRMPVGLDISQVEFNQVGKTGGSKTHTLTIAEMPNHNHGVANLPKFVNDTDRGTGNASNFSIDTTESKTTANTGGGEPHNNMSPYRIVMFIKYVG